MRSGPTSRGRSLPRLWLISDARNDSGLERALRRLPRGSGFIFRHYHLGAVARCARFEVLARLARARGHLVVLAGDIAQARAWRADGAYGAARVMATVPATAFGGTGLRLVTAHSLSEIGAAARACADAILLSPAFATASHPGATPLGPLRWHLLARRAGVPVIALGGMNARRARRLGVQRWAAIDGLSEPAGTTSGFLTWSPR